MMKTRGLYIHIPFCQTLCHYCDFTRLPLGTRDQVGLYLQALVAEINGRRDPTLTFDTLYLGGGTPSLLTAEELEWILEAVRGSFHLIEDEVTIEANPNDIQEAKARELRDLGFNRISLGAQSFNGELLQKMGRRHREEEIGLALAALRGAGFDNLSLDLIFGLPGQGEEDIQRDLAQLAQLQPDHVSWYNLILEEGTPWYRLWEQGQLDLLPEEVEMGYYEQIIQGLADLGYGQYEISNFARPGKESKHNLKYWLLEEYEGFGLGAASYLHGCRYKNLDQLPVYLDRVGQGLRPWADREVLSQDQEIFDYLIMRFRLVQGLDLLEFHRRFGRDLLETNRELVEDFQNRGYLHRQGTRLALTSRGFEISSYFLRQLQW